MTVSPLIFDCLAVKIDAREGRLSAVPDKLDFRRFLGQDVTLDVPPEDMFGHPEIILVREKVFFLEVKAVIALQITKRPAGFGQRVDPYRNSRHFFSHRIDCFRGFLMMLRTPKRATKKLAGIWMGKGFAFCRRALARNPALLQKTGFEAQSNLLNGLLHPTVNRRTAAFLPIHFHSTAHNKPDGIAGGEKTRKT